MPLTPSGARLGVGTAPFIRGYGLLAGGPQPGVALLHVALDRGIRYFDTAAAYADGEAVLGQLAPALSDAGARVATKIELDWARAGVEDVRDAAARSLARLQLASADTLLLHSAPPDAIASAEVAEGLRRAKAEGLAGRVGASTYGVRTALAALAADWCDVVQVEYSILNQQVVRAAVRERRAGQELVARSVLCKGLLTDRWRAVPALAQPVKAELEALERLAQGAGASLPELAIRFALDTPGIDVVLVGVASQEELDAALRARDRRPLAADEWNALGAFDRSRLDCVHPERWNHVPSR